jgi:hypothetical protein
LGSDSFAFVNEVDRMPDTYRQSLLAILAKLDQLQSDTEQLLAAPGDADIGARLEELRVWHVEMQALMEEKLDRLE